MMKRKSSNWIVGIGCGERDYKIGSVTFTVASRFEPSKSNNNIKERVEKSIANHFVPLTIVDTENKMADEYVCSAAGEEDKNAVEKEN